MDKDTIVGAFDIETFENSLGLLIPFCICYSINTDINKNYFSYFSKSKNIIAITINNLFYLIKKEKKKKLLLYVHNLNFDGLFLLRTLISSKFKISTFMERSNIYSILVFFEEICLEFKCSYKILPSSLAKIAISFKIPKKLPFPYRAIRGENLFNKRLEVFNKDFNSSDDYNNFIKIKKTNIMHVRNWSIKYCFRDILITLQFIQILAKLLKKFKINLFNEFSAPSLALKIFLTNFNRNKISVINNKLIENYLRTHYYGGRCEVYGNPKIGETVYHYDFPGMYGICMKEKFPFGKWKIDSTVTDFKKPGFYFIEYSSNSYLPALPFRHPINNKLLFLNGENLKGGFYFEEIINFLEHGGGRINKILFGIIYENYECVFDEYVDTFKSLREKGGEYKSFAKLMINSLYGRMGMEGKSSHTLIVQSAELVYLSKYCDIISAKEINGLYLAEIYINDFLKKKFDLRHKRIKNNIALAAAITAKARIRLYKAQLSVLKNDGRLLYSDTDSVFAAYENNVLDHKHGEIFWDSKNPNSILKDALFISPKSYGLLTLENKEIIKIKGLNQKEICFSDLKNKFYKNQVLTIDNFSFFEKRDLIWKYCLSEKTYDLTLYDKRRFSENKKDTSPLEFKDLLTS